MFLFLIEGTKWKDKNAIEHDLVTQRSTQMYNDQYVNGLVIVANYAIVI